MEGLFGTLAECQNIIRPKITQALRVRTVSNAIDLHNSISDPSCHIYQWPLNSFQILQPDITMVDFILINAVSALIMLLYMPMAA